MAMRSWFSGAFLVCSVLAGMALAADTDGDGLLDLVDLPGVPPVIDIYHDQGRIFGTDGVVSLGTDTWSQSITAGMSGKLTGIELRIDAYYRIPPETIDFDFSLFDGGNPPTGPPLFSQKITIDQIGGGMNYMWDVNSADLVLDIGDVFTFALSALQDNVDVSADYQTDGNGYPRGELYRNGNPLPIEVSDMALKTYVLGDSSRANYVSRGIQDLDGANLLTNLQELDLSENQITSIETGAFDGLTNLHTLQLKGDELSALNFTGVRFENLTTCNLDLWAWFEFDILDFVGFCLDSSDEIVSLNLDDATLSNESDWSWCHQTL